MDSIRIIVLRVGPAPLRAGSCALDGLPARLPVRVVDAELAVLFSTLVSAVARCEWRGGESVFDSPIPFAAWRAANPQAPLRYLVSRLAGFQTPLDPATGVPRT